MATGDTDGFLTAAAHVPASCVDEPAVLAYRAFLAARFDDPIEEQRALSALIEAEPGNTTAMERLAVLMLRSDRSNEARRPPPSQSRDRPRPGSGPDHFPRGRRYERPRGSSGRPDEQTGPSVRFSSVGDRGRGPEYKPAPKRSGSRSGTFSPLPEALAARAEALSASFGIRPAREPANAPMLADRFADLRKKGQGPGGGTTLARGGVRKGDTNLATADFIDDAAKAGLHFVFDNGKTSEHSLPETMSGGVGLIDFDGDGWYDVYCVQGGSLTASACGPADLPPRAGDRLFRNRQNGTFEDVTEKSGIARIAWGQGYGLGVTVGDYDNDGCPDVFVSRLLTYALYRNRGDGTFEDVTIRAGLAGHRDYPTSAAFADLDNDGDLDLYVCHYTIWDPAHPMICKNEQGQTLYCHPSFVPPASDHVYRNDGGRFFDVTAVSGCSESQGRGLGAIAADLDSDQRIDIFVANDGSANYLFRNRGNFHFDEIGLQAGVAAGEQGGYQAGMGVACGDLDGDGRPDLMVTNFYGEGASLFHNLGGGFFTDRSAASGIGLATRYLLGFGIAITDVTNHGRLDVMITNGHVNSNGYPYDYAMPSRLYENRPDGRLVDISGVAGAPWQARRVGRGLAAGDLDNDGRVDALIVGQNEPLAYFHNQTKKAGHFVTLRLEGTKSNRDGVGATVTVVAGGRARVARAAAAAVISPLTTPGSTSDWATRQRLTLSKFAGPRDTWTGGRV